ncbi:DNA damage checkpoint protein [Scheffersomyces coipomensis]|uniref:DNA damage checkpoint protein n=1 Tax=Scheffersomyces coipomensis TaxID=1788519 RepID=UPI00315D81FB
MSNSDFDDDDDDEILQAVLTGTANVSGHKIIPSMQPPIQPRQSAQVQPQQTTTADNDMRSRIFQAEGQVAILRAQLESAQRERLDGVNKIRDNFNQYKKNSEDQVRILKHAVQKLEDEKKFLNNELKSNSYSKKRKVTPIRTQGKEIMGSIDIDISTSLDDSKSSRGSTPMRSSNTSMEQKSTQQPLPSQQPIQRIIKIQNDSSLFADQIWNHCIIGSKRTTLSYLSKISVNFYIDIQDLKIKQRIPISSSISEYIMLKKSLRLDQLISEFCLTLISLIEILIERKSIISVPFLLSLIHGSITFRPLAITKHLIEQLLIRLNQLSNKFAFLLDSNLNEEDYINYHDVPHQIMIIEKFIFISCLDIMEKLISYSSLYDPKYIRKIWNGDEGYLSVELFLKCLPDNHERFMNTGQINVMFNFVEMLISSITEDTFAFNDRHKRVADDTIINSLLKIFLIDIPIKEDFMFYGLNRIIGNNNDFEKINATIPETKDNLNNFIILIPQPIPIELLNGREDSNEDYELKLNHEFHLLNLKIKVTELFESFIIIKQSIEFLKSKEYFKLIIRIIGFEQIHIMKSPRSQFNSLRIEIISRFIKILNYLIVNNNDHHGNEEGDEDDDQLNLNELIYPETMYELFVVLSRISFGSDSLSIDAHKLLIKIRSRGYLTEPIFNAWSELKARELNHVNGGNGGQSGKVLADIESDFANGLEIPYESETVELARELLNLFVNHEEADNLYYNMNYDGDETFDEMDLIE